MDGERALPGPWFYSAPARIQAALLVVSGVRVNPASAARAAKMAVSWAGVYPGKSMTSGKRRPAAGWNRAGLGVGALCPEGCYRPRYLKIQRLNYLDDSVPFGEDRRQPDHIA
jgi:hypothetical protein